MRTQQRLIARYIKNVKPGTVTWIGVRPMRREPMMALESVMALESLGLEGDHRVTKSPGSGRQVTLISEEYIQQIEHFSGRVLVAPEQLRRNIVVKDINLTIVRHQKFSIGDAVFEARALCHPCSRMNETVGPDTVSAMLGHGGLCAKIIKTGRIAVGDEMIILHDDHS
jgi:MOSC domain-containing protein YiiM